MTNILKISDAASLAMHMMAYIARRPRELHSTADVADAITSAVGAFETWSRVRPRDRARILNRVATQLAGETDELARLELSHGSDSAELEGNPVGEFQAAQHDGPIADVLQLDVLEQIVIVETRCDLLRRWIVWIVVDLSDDEVFSRGGQTDGELLLDRRRPAAGRTFDGKG